MAANISALSFGICDIQLVGVIEAGDDTRLEQVVSALDPKDQQVLCPDSPGGSLKTAIEIAGLIHEKGIGTHVDEGARCESSCSIAYFMGTHLAGPYAVHISQSCARWADRNSCA